MSRVHIPDGDDLFCQSNSFVAQTSADRVCTHCVRAMEKAFRIREALLKSALEWEERTRARLGLPQVDAPAWAVDARATIIKPVIAEAEGEMSSGAFKAGEHGA